MDFLKVGKSEVAWDASEEEGTRREKVGLRERLEAKRYRKEKKQTGEKARGDFYSKEACPSLIGMEHTFCGSYGFS